MKALLLENIHADATPILRQAGLDVDRRSGALGADDLLGALDGVQVLGIRSNTKVTSAVIQAMPDSVQAVGCFCIGTNQVDLEAAAQRGIAVFNAPYSNTRSVVELVLCEIVALSRRLLDRSTSTHAGLWDKSAEGSHEVRGRTLGIIGYGNIGSQLSVVAEAFGMHILYYDLADKLALGNAKACASMNDLLAQSDFVTLHVDGRPGNAGLFGADQFAAMKDGAMFLNLSRGFVTDPAALADALGSGHLAGAAVDVFPVEPKGKGDPFVSPLQGVPNVILTPHVGGSTQEAQVDIGHFVATKLADYLATGSTVMSVNLPVVATPPMQGRRVTHIHENVPGVLAQLNAVLSAHQANIAFQALSTAGGIGYVVTDVTQAAPGLTAELAEVPGTIRVRLL
ncbi:MAG: phosphoglycerate dehydrogenase [Propionibacteriaceae bacterium]|nr:phosphoglycerate dehydrogenase [Propionibacteriaceae bacterium]